MSCQKCEDTKEVAYYRMGKANVGLIGCDEHFNQLMRAIDGRESDRVIYRLKNTTNETN